MKLKNLTMILMAAIIVVFAGCEKDSDNDPVTNGQFTYSGISYSLSQGFLGGYGVVDTNSYSIEVVLMSSGLQIIEKDGIADSVSGTGDVFIMDLYSASEHTIEPGEYAFSILGAAGTFEYSGVMIGYNSATDEAVLEDMVIGGTFTVTKNGDNYGFSFNLSTVLGKTITGDYNGSLKFYSDIDKKKALVHK